MKRIKNIFIIIMCCVIFSGNTIFAMSKQNDMEYQNIIIKLEETSDLYSGVYIDNDILHIIPLNNEKSIQAMTDVKQNANVEIIIDEPKIYTLEELNKAFEILRANREDLGITAYSIDVVNNGLRVAAKEWTDQKKKNIQQLTNVKNIQFVIDMGDPTKNKVIKVNAELLLEEGQVLYCHVRSIPQILQQQNLYLTWDNELKTAFLKSTETDKSIKLIQNENKIIIDDMVIENKILQKNNQMYIPVSLLAKIFYTDIIVEQQNKTVYFLKDTMLYDFKKEELNHIGEYIKKNINETFDINQFEARLVKREKNYIVLSFRENKEKESLTKEEYYIVIEDNKVVYIDRHSAE